MASRRKKSLRQILDELGKTFVPEIRAAFEAAIADVVDNVILADLMAAIEGGDLEKAFRVLGFTDAAMRPISAAIERAFETGGVFVGSSFPAILNTASGRTVYRFDVRNSRAEKWLRDHSGELITRLRDEARGSVQNVMFEGMKAGNNPRRTALDLIGRINPKTGRREGGIIGLDRQSERWVANTRRMLQDLDPAYLERALRDKRFDAIVRKAIAEGKPLPADTITKLVGRYSDNALKNRGERIARTEAIQALNQSEYEAFKQAVEMGAIKPKHVKRVWDSTGDDGRTRDSHLEMEGQTVGLDEAFTTPGGAHLMFPGDTSLGAPGEETINCRCRVRTKADWLADLD